MTEDVYKLLPEQIKAHYNSLERFGDLSYTYVCSDDFNVGDIVVVELRHLKVVGRIESITEEFDDSIDYKHVLRKVS